MLGDFRSGRVAKGSKKARGPQPERSDRRPARRVRVPVFELLEQREMLTGTTYTPLPVTADGAAGSSSADIALANADTGSATDTIQLTSGTYTLSLGELTVSNTAHTLIIEGAGSTGPSATIIDQTALDRVFQIDSGVTVIFENLEITGGTAKVDGSGGTSAAEGGGILNQGNLTLTNVAVIGNAALATVAGESALGGGIYSTGALSITGPTPGASLIEQNSATGFAGADGTKAGLAGNGEGGGVFTSTSALVQISGTTIANNTVTGGAGPATTSTDDPGPDADAGGQGIGGGFYTTYNTGAPTTVLADDTIANNQAVGGNGATGGTGLNGGDGGAAIGGGAAIELMSPGQTVTGVPIKISDTTLSDNSTVSGSGGAAGSGGTSSGVSNGAQGGGIENAVAGTQLLNDTVYDNTASGNNGLTGGGGIADASTGMSIVNVTVAQNSVQATAGTTYGGGIYNTNTDTNLQLFNTLVADNTANAGTDFYGNASVAAGNLINVASGSNISDGGGNIVAPATLGIAGSLANNGGTTQTLALTTGSAAIGTGDVIEANDFGLTTDERGLPRANAGLVDIGAYEVQAGTGTTSVAIGTSASSVNVGQSVTFTAVVSPASGVTAAPTGNVQFEVIAGGVTVDIGSPVTLSVVNGVDEATLSSSSLTAGSHVITAVYSGDTNFSTSTAPVVNQEIVNNSALGSSTTVGANPNPVTQSQSITLTATVTPASGSTAPTGSVQFEVDGVVVGSGTLTGTLGSDQATFSTSSLTTGPHTLTAVYSGDSNFNGSVSPSVSPVTVAARTPVVAGPTATTENTSVSGITITPAVGDNTVTYFQITGITGGTLYYNGGSAQISNGQFITVASGALGLEFIPATNSVANGSFTVQESTAANVTGLAGTSTTAMIGVSGTPAVNLASYYNVTGITTDGTTFSSGLDGDGYALSEALIGSSVTWSGIAFALGAPNVNDVVQGAGQTIALPAGNYSSVSFLATATNGNQTTQQFTIHYSDGTSTTVSQNISDWTSPQGYAGESLAATTAYRNSSSGGHQTGTYDVYGYTIPVDPTKTVESITLPNDGNVKVLSITTQATLDAPTGLIATPSLDGDVALTWTASNSSVTGYDVYRYLIGNVASPTLLGQATTTNYTDTTAMAGNTYLYVVKAVNGSAISPASSAVSATVANSSPATEADLTGQYDLIGITDDGSHFSGGLDNDGNALSETEVGTTVSWDGVNFNIGPAGANDAIRSVAQPVTLPVGSYSAVDVLATTVNGHLSAQTFTVNYTDGTSTSFSQSVSDWSSSQGYPGESVALTTTYRNTSGGGRNNGTFDVYGYSFAIDSAKTVASITLPNDGNVEVLAVDLLANVAAPTHLTATASSSTTANLSWTAATGNITGYNVYRGTTAGGNRRRRSTAPRCRPAPPAMRTPPPWGATPIITSSRRSMAPRSARLRTKPAWRCPPAVPPSTSISPATST